MGMNDNLSEVKGRARIYVTDSLVKGISLKIERPKAGEIRWGIMEVKELFDTFQSFLLLPEAYTIIGVFFDVPFYQWVIVVENDDIPLPKPGEIIPTLIPTYQRTEDGKVSIVDLQLLK